MSAGSCPVNSKILVLPFRISSPMASGWVCMLNHGCMHKNTHSRIQKKESGRESRELLSVLSVASLCLFILPVFCCSQEDLVPPFLFCH